jgi:hypothetical protein
MEMRSIEARIRSEIERVVEIVLDRHVQGTSGSQSREYIARLSTTSAALEHAAADITKLADQEAALLAPPFSEVPLDL